MKSTEILSNPKDGQKNIADTWTTSRRSISSAPRPGSRGTGTRAPSRWCAMMDRQAGPIKARTYLKPTTKIPTCLRQEQGQQNSFIPKNARVRQRPFDEALRAELEWVSQHWRTYFAQSSSSSSSQNWWQHEHEHQDSQ